jgi:hypothetical protein
MIKTNVNKYFNHGFSNPMLQQYANEGANVLVLPICPKCERIGLRDKGWALHKTMACPHCGYNGRATHQLKAYLDEELYN